MNVLFAYVAFTQGSQIRGSRERLPPDIGSTRAEEFGTQK